MDQPSSAQPLDTELARNDQSGIPAVDSKTVPQMPPQFTSMGRWLFERAWIGLVCIAGLLIVIGWLQNDLARVFTKAATICLECIGIG